MPPELWKIILRFALNFDNYKCLRAVCRDFHRVCDSTPPTKWYNRARGYLTSTGMKHGLSFQLETCWVGCCMYNLHWRVMWCSHDKIVNAISIHDNKKYIFRRMAEPPGFVATGSDGIDNKIYVRDIHSLDVIREWVQPFII